MQVNNSSIYSNNHSLGNAKPNTNIAALSTAQNSKATTISVTLSANSQSGESSAARAVAQYEAMIQQNGITQSQDDEPVEEMNLSSLPPIKIFTEADVRDYEKNLTKALEAAGIDTSKSISLTTDYEGKVIVKGDHPDKERIEAIFAEDKDLRNGFVQTSQHYLFKELYRLNQEWAQKVDAGVDIDAASQWLLRSAKQATAASANGLTLSQGSFNDPFTSQGVVAKISSAYGV